jgi:hypothetical protein
MMAARATSLGTTNTSGLRTPAGVLISHSPPSQTTACEPACAAAGKGGDGVGGDGALAAWAERSGCRRPGAQAQGGLRFAFYGRVSTEDWQLEPARRVGHFPQARSPGACQ